jgi:hypothetical protein
LGNPDRRVDSASSTGAAQTPAQRTSASAASADITSVGLASAGLASAGTASAGTDRDFVIVAANILQTLLCLSNLTLAGADDPDKVRRYASLAEIKLQALRDLMRPMLWNPA